MQINKILDICNIKITGATSIRRKMQSYSMRRKNSISAIIFIWLYFVANNIFVVWLGRFAPFAK